MENVATKKSPEFSVRTAVATERVWCDLLLMELAPAVLQERDDRPCPGERHQKSAGNAGKTPQHEMRIARTVRPNQAPNVGMSGEAYFGEFLRDSSLLRVLAL